MAATHEYAASIASSASFGAAVLGTLRLANTGKMRKHIRVSDTPPIFLTIPECAELLRLSERSVYTNARHGKLPGAVKVGGAWRVERTVLMASLRARASRDQVATATEDTA